MWLLCSFQGPWRGKSPAGSRVTWSRLIACPTSADGRRSLKTQQHAGVVGGRRGACPQVVEGAAPDGRPARFGRHARPDLLCHRRASRARRPRGPLLRLALDRGTARCSLERR